MAAKQRFEIIFQGLKASVDEHGLKSGRVFYIEFMRPEVKPLVITIAYGPKDEKFWTSVPEGRQEKAEEVGKLVAAFLRNQAKLCVTTTDKKLPAPSLFD